MWGGSFGSSFSLAPRELATAVVVPPVFVPVARALVRGIRWPPEGCGRPFGVATHITAVVAAVIALNTGGRGAARVPRCPFPVPVSLAAVA